MRLTQVFTVLTLAVFHSRVFLRLITATIITSVLTRTCNYEFLWYFTKELVWNKHAVEELPAKIEWLHFWFVSIKNIETNVFEVVSSQQVPFDCWGCWSSFRKSCFSGCINTYLKWTKGSTAILSSINLTSYFSAIWKWYTIFSKVMQMFFWACCEGCWFGFKSCQNMCLKQR